jgi:hypothetical protein
MDYGGSSRTQPEELLGEDCTDHDFELVGDEYSPSLSKQGGDITNKISTARLLDMVYDEYMKDLPIDFGQALAAGEQARIAILT